MFNVSWVASNGTVEAAETRASEMESSILTRENIDEKWLITALSSNPYNKKEVGESFVKTHTQKKNGVFVQQIPADFELRLLEFLPRVPHLLRTQRQLQFEADINKLFMYTRLVLLSQYYGDGAEEIIEMAGKTSLSEQQRQVQENIHHLVENFCSLMDGILLPDVSKNESGSQTASPPPPRQSDIYLIKWATPHKDSGQGCFIKGQADAGTVLAFYPGPWGLGGEAKELWTGTSYTPAALVKPKRFLKRFGSFWFKTGGSNGLDAPVLKTLVLRRIGEDGAKLLRF
ncbi:hypothetical protein HID58_070261, partial [Brassica napus]